MPSKHDGNVRLIYGVPSFAQLKGTRYTYLVESQMSVGSNPTLGTKLGMADERSNVITFREQRTLGVDKPAHLPGWWNW